MCCPAGTDRANSQNGESEDFATWLGGFSDEVDAFLSTVPNGKDPLNDGGVSSAEHGRAQEVTSLWPSDFSRTEQRSHHAAAELATKVDVDGFQLLAHEEKFYRGETESTEPVCALGPLSHPEEHAGEAAEPAGSWLSLAKGGAQAEDAEAKGTAAARLEEIASRLHPLVAMLHKGRIRCLHRAFSAIHSVGLEAVVNRELREIEIAHGCRLLERHVRRRDAREQQAAALRHWSLATAGENGTANTRHFLAVLTAIARRKKEGALRRAFTAINDYGLEMKVQAEIREFDLDRARATERRQRDKLSALLRWSRTASSVTAAATAVADGTEVRSEALLSLQRKGEKQAMRSGIRAMLAAIAAEAARKRQNHERKARACGLLADVVRKRQNRRVLMAVARWKSSAAALSMKTESRLRSLLHGMIAIAEEKARQQRARTRALACRLLAGVVKGKPEVGMKNAVSRWRMAILAAKMVESKRSAALLAVARQQEQEQKQQQQQQQSMRSAFEKIAHHAAMAIAADTAARRRQEMQALAGRLLVRATDGRRKQKLAIATSRWRMATVAARTVESTRSAALLALARRKERKEQQQSVVWAFGKIVHHAATAIAADAASRRRQEMQALAGALHGDRKLRLSNAVSKWRMAIMVVKLKERNGTADKHKEVRFKNIPSLGKQPLRESTTTVPCTAVLTRRDTCRSSVSCSACSGHALSLGNGWRATRKVAKFGRFHKLPPRSALEE